MSEQYLITGTRVYGPVTKDSDLDIVITEKIQTELTTWLDKNNLETYQTSAQNLYENGGFYFNLGPIKINFILTTKGAEFDLWKIRTDEMKKLPEVKDREARIQLFNRLG